MARSLNRRLILPIAIAMAIGMLAVVIFHTVAQQRSILLQNERSIFKVTDSVIQGLQTVMLAGYADVAELYAERLKEIGGVVEFRILRPNGVEAFKDNQTIRRVGEIRGDERFLPRDSEQTIRVLAEDDPQLRQVLREKHFVSYYRNVGYDRTLTFLWPILNEKACRKCHGGDHEIRGVLQFTTSLKAVDEEVLQTWTTATIIMIAALAVIVTAMVLIVRRWVLVPIATVSQAMSRVSGGDLSQSVPVIGHDELAAMATSFNAMLSELRETYDGYRIQHNKLETIINGSRDGIVVTDSDGTIVIVNQAATELLGKPVPAIVAGGFEALFEDPPRMRAMLDDPAAETGVIVYNEHFLVVSAAAIDDGEGRLVGRAALLRDVTREKRLEQQLLALSNSDALTGLANRRMLDESLAREVTRCLQHGRPLSILMFDIDHFKKFNDTWGHDQGDRVLQHVAEITRACVRTIDLPCRFGGEEFVVILVETAQEGAQVVAERLRLAVETARVDDLQVTTTIGVAGLAETGATTPEAFIACADAALYEGKRGGRNRVVAAMPAQPG